MIPSGAWKQPTIDLLKKVLVGTIAVWLLVAAWLGVSTLMLSARRAEAAANAKAHQATLADMRSMVSRAGSKKGDVPPTGFGAVSAFQAGVEASAAQKGCTVTEFQAGAEIMPYLTRFKKDTPKNEWGQVEVQFSVRGKLVDVVNTVRTFDQQPVPFEYNAVEFSRAEVDKSGVATVSAKVSLRVLTRFPDGGAA